MNVLKKIGGAILGIIDGVAIGALISYFTSNCCSVSDAAMVVGGIIGGIVGFFAPAAALWLSVFGIVFLFVMGRRDPVENYDPTRRNRY